MCVCVCARAGVLAFVTLRFCSFSQSNCEGMPGRRTPGRQDGQEQAPGSLCKTGPLGNPTSAQASREEKPAEHREVWPHTLQVWPHREGFKPRPEIECIPCVGFGLLRLRGYGVGACGFFCDISIPEHSEANRKATCKQTLLCLNQC